MVITQPRLIKHRGFRTWMICQVKVAWLHYLKVNSVPDNAWFVKVSWFLKTIFAVTISAQGCVNSHWIFRTSYNATLTQLFALAFLLSLYGSEAVVNTQIVVVWCGSNNFWGRRQSAKDHTKGTQRENQHDNFFNAFNKVLHVEWKKKNCNLSRDKKCAIFDKMKSAALCEIKRFLNPLLILLPPLKSVPF